MGAAGRSDRAGRGMEIPMKKGQHRLAANLPHSERNEQRVILSVHATRIYLRIFTSVQRRRRKRRPQLPLGASLACGDDDPDGLGEGRGGVAGVRPRVGGLRARDDERGDDVVDPPADHDGAHAVAVVREDLRERRRSRRRRRLKIPLALSAIEGKRDWVTFPS